MYFSNTDWSASNLLKENKNSSNIFVTGNTVVDLLKLTLNHTSPSKKIKKENSLFISKNHCKLILLTGHRREKYFKPIYNTLNSLQKILKEFDDIIIIFPFHLNPNIKQSIKNALQSIVYNDIIIGKKIENNIYI